MDAAAKWSLWGVGVAGSFAALEITALREPMVDGKPRGTLTAVLRRSMGIHPTAPRRWAWSALFIAACAWLAAHIGSNRGWLACQVPGSSGRDHQ